MSRFIFCFFTGWLLVGCVWEQPTTAVPSRSATAVATATIAVADVDTTQPETAVFSPTTTSHSNQHTHAEPNSNSYPSSAHHNTNDAFTTSPRLIAAKCEANNPFARQIGSDIEPRCPAA